MKIIDIHNYWVAMSCHRSRIGAVFCLLSVLATGSAVAQSTNEDSQQVDSVEEVIVTGSRIARASAETPAPTTVLSAEVIELAGYSNAGDVLSNIPAVSGSLGRTTGGNSLSGGGQTRGAELPNLRELGANRTLTLVNGRRQVGSQAGNTSVDVNSIPVSLIERVEVLTGAASAVYGADAVTGVINFILAEDFEGFNIDLSKGISAEGDGDDDRIDLTLGQNFADGRGNATLAVSFQERDGILATDRDFASNDLDYFNPGGGGSRFLVERRGFIPLNTNGVGYQLGGFFLAPISANVGNLTFNEDGTARPYNIGQCDSTGRCITAAGQPTHETFRTDEFDAISLPDEKTLVNGFFTYDVNDSMEFFAQLKYSETETKARVQPFLEVAPFFGIPVVIQSDNAFLDPAIGAQMRADGVNAFSLNKSFDDLANGQTLINEFETTQFLFGVRGDFGSNFSYQIYAQQGKSDSVITQADFVVADFINAIDSIRDASGNAVCRDPSARAAGCLALNPFGRNGAATTPEARDALIFQSVTNNEIEQTLFEANLTGDLFQMPAGPLQFAAGIAYRKEESESLPDPRLLIGGLTERTADVNGNVPLTNVLGDYDVNEIFGEARIPLLVDKPVVQELTLDVATRFSDYSTVGSTTTYSATLNWQIVDSVRLRAGGGTAVRAPNIGELFAPGAINFQFVVDPCGQDLASNPRRTARCIEEGLPPGFVSQADIASQQVLVAGNAFLLEEESDTETIGVVLTPSFIPALSFAIDYWKFDIEDAIATFPANSLLNNCIDLPAGNEFCDFIDRDANFQITQIRNESINLARLVSTGIDFELRYGFDVGAGSLDLTLFGSRVKERKNFPDPFAPSFAVEDIGDQNDPKLRASFFTRYTRDDLSVQLGGRFIGHTARDNTDQPGEFEVTRIGSVTYVDLGASYRFTDNFQLSGTIQNLFDRKPPRIPGLHQGTDLYDAIGQFFFLNASYRL